MARRQLLTEEERRVVFGVPMDRDALARHYTLTRTDLDLVATRRGDPNRLGFAVQLMLLRHPGLPLAQIGEPIDALADWMAVQIDVPTAAFAEYAHRPQTMSDHARAKSPVALGLRAPTNSDLPDVIEAAAQAASTTDRGLPIVAGIIAALRSAKIILPAPMVIERAAIAGRARARKRAADALLAGLTDAQLATLDNLAVIDGETGLAPLAWLKTIPSSPKPDHVRDVIDKLRFVRNIGIEADAAGRIHETRFRQFTREGLASPTYLIERYAPHRRRATVAALLIELEVRLTDVALDMVDKLVGNAFTRGKNTKERA